MGAESSWVLHHSQVGRYIIFLLDLSGIVSQTPLHGFSMLAGLPPTIW